MKSLTASFAVIFSILFSLSEFFNASNLATAYHYTGSVQRTGVTTSLSSANKQIGGDKEIAKGERILAKTKVRKDAKIVRKSVAAATRLTRIQTKADLRKGGSAPDGGNFAKKTVWGQNLINCRSFNIDGAKKFDFLGSFNSMKALPVFPLPEISFLGRSNVGKSSLLNCLTGLNKKIAVEGKTPGRTQSINAFNCGDKDGGICVFADLPGYGYAKISKTQQDDLSSLLREYLQNRGALRLAVLLVDIRREPQALDISMMQFLQEEGLPFLIITTKVDKLKKDEVAKSIQALRKEFDLPAEQPIVPFSSVTGEGVKDVWRILRDVLSGESDILTMTDEAEEDQTEDEVDFDEDDEDDEELEKLMRYGR
jgi:GTP-binding protein